MRARARFRVKDIKVGDRIRFLAYTRSNSRRQVRVVTHVPQGREYMAGWIGVTFEGCRPFWVRIGEVEEVFRA